MSVLVDPIVWVDVELPKNPTQTSPSSVSSAVLTWLNDNNLDLTDLTKENLQALIEYLKGQFPNYASTESGKNNTAALSIRNLENLMSKWNAFIPGSDKLKNVLDLNRLQFEFLNLLAPATPGVDKIDEAWRSLSTATNRLDNLTLLLNSPPIDWSADTNGEKSIDFVNKILKQLEAMTPEQRRSLGVDRLFNDLQSAKAAYEKNISAASGKLKETEIANSNYRMDISKAMIGYFSDAGLGSSTRAGAWQAELEQEKNYHAFILVDVKKDADWIPPPTGYTEAELNVAMGESRRMYEYAVKMGDTESAAYFQARMQIIGRAQEKLSDAKSPHERFLVSIYLFLDLLSANEARLSSLLITARGNDPGLADKIQQKLDFIKELQKEVGKSSGELLEDVVNIYRSVRT